MTATAIETIQCADGATRPIRWRIYTFDKFGKTYRGYFLYRSKGACDLIINTIRSDIRENKIDYINSIDGILPVKDFSWAMPMPEME